MGLTPEEAVALAPEAIELGKALIHAFSEQSDGGAKLTKPELKDLGGRLVKFGVHLGRDILDGPTRKERRGQDG